MGSEDKNKVSNIAKVPLGTPVGLLRGLADAIESARREGKPEPTYAVVWLVDNGNVCSSFKAARDSIGDFTLCGVIEDIKCKILK